MSFFKPEDFIYHVTASVAHDITHIANKLLEERGEKAYGTVTRGWRDPHTFTRVLYPTTETHQALLINIEAIPKKECEHSVASYRHANGVWTIGAAICGKCGINLKPPEKWEPAE